MADPVRIKADKTLTGLLAERGFVWAALQVSQVDISRESENEGVT